MLEQAIGTNREAEEMRTCNNQLPGPVVNSAVPAGNIWIFVAAGKNKLLMHIYCELAEPCQASENFAGRQ